MRSDDDSCFPEIAVFLDAGRSALEGTPSKLHLHKPAWRKQRSRKQATQVESVSLSTLLNAVVQAGRKRYQLVLMLCTAFVIGCLVTSITSIRAVSKAIPFSLVFSAPIQDHAGWKSSQQRPGRIPQIIHQTSRSFDSLPEPIPLLRDSWTRLNPGWEVQQWDDARCKEFVRKEFPEYYTAYMGLPKNVERADFFRYLVVLRYGGVYADIDTECKQPLDQVIRHTDSLLVGWEGEVPDDDALVNRHFARYRQVQQWFFAAAPGHPALRRVCDHIARSYKRKFSEYTNIDTLERTGPGAWTDAVVGTALQLSPGEEDPWPTRFLPQVATAVYKIRDSTPGLSLDTPGIQVLHHFIGTWKDKKGFPNSGILQRLRRMIAGPEHAMAVEWEANPNVLSMDPASVLYPVSIDHYGTIFTMMVHMIGHGDLQSHEDPAAMITRFGNWQAGMDNTLHPRAPVALVGALSQTGVHGDAPVLLDIGAGIGFYTVTAAMRGQRVIATELSPKSVHSLQASVAANSLNSLVTLKNVTLGAAPGKACVRPAFSGWAGAAAGWRPEEVARGYGPPSLHARTSRVDCDHVVNRTVMGDIVPAGTKVGAVRVSAGAWTSEVLRGGLPMIRQQLPAALLIEVDMAEMGRVKSADFADIVMQLFEMGYQNMGHSGSVCVRRFSIMLSALQKQTVTALQTDISDLRQPSWCDLDVNNLPNVLEQNRRNGVEKQDALNAPGVELFFLQFNGTVAHKQHE